MIIQPESMTFSDKTFSMIIYGSPGVGKTTLALSAPDPVLIDFDRGMCRVKAQHRKAAIFCDSYNEVLTDVMSPAIEDYKTVVVDTGGSRPSQMTPCARVLNLRPLYTPKWPANIKTPTPRGKAE